MRILLSFLFLIPVIFMTSCSLTLPVKGMVQNTDETFEGTATGYIGGSGDLKIISNTGVTCEGNFVYVTTRKGEGVFNCDDGRSGPFQFVSTGSSGTGHGDLGGSKFTFTFGYF